MRIDKVTLYLSLLFLGSAHAYEATWERVTEIQPKKINQLKKDTIKINLNTADKNTLLKLTGVGPKKAQDIINFRKDHEFKSPSDLGKIKGFSKKVLTYILESNKELLDTS